MVYGVGKRYVKSKNKPVVGSIYFYSRLEELTNYTFGKFGVKAMVDLQDKVNYHMRNLPTRYLSHSECRFIPTKTKIYRTIPIKRFASILYRIKPSRIEVLSIYNNSINPSKIRSMRKIKI